MPAQNGTGPEGNGPKTGRGRGRCAVGTGRNNIAESTVVGRGSGRGRCRQQGGGDRGRGVNRGGANRGRGGNR